MCVCVSVQLKLKIKIDPFGVDPNESDRGCANPNKSDEKSEDGGDAGAEDEGSELEDVLLSQA